MRQTVYAGPQYGIDNGAVPSRSSASRAAIHRGSVPNRPTPLFCGESRQRIDDFEPRSLEIDKDVTLRAKSGIIVERPGGYINHVTVHRRQRSTAYRAECPSISWPGLPHWRFIGLDKRSSAEPFKLGGLEYQFGSKCGAAGLPATRAMIEVKGGRSARHFVPHCATQAASFSWHSHLHSPRLYIDRRSAS